MFLKRLLTVERVLEVVRLYVKQNFQKKLILKLPGRLIYWIVKTDRGLVSNSVSRWSWLEFAETISHDQGWVR